MKSIRLKSHFVCVRRRPFTSMGLSQNCWLVSQQCSIPCACWEKSWQGSQRQRSRFDVSFCVQAKTNGKCPPLPTTGQGRMGYTKTLIFIALHGTGSGSSGTWLEPEQIPREQTTTLFAQLTTYHDISHPAALSPTKQIITLPARQRNSLHRIHDKALRV